MPKLADDIELASGGGLVPGRPADDALLSLLASMAAADGAVHDSELDFLTAVRRDLPDRAAVERWARTYGRPLDLGQLALRITNPDDGWKTLRFAARMAWKDGEIATSEQKFLRDLAAALSLPPSSVDRVLREMQPDDGRTFTAERILRSLLDVHWDSVQLASGMLVSEDLVGVSPPRIEVVARVGLEKVEVMALATDGLVARFQEGPAFIPWKDLVTYTRERGLGEALKLHTEDGRNYTLVDQRLAGLALVLDRLFDRVGVTRDTSTPPPKIDTLRGE
ncbi:MAG: TerB family tellurite resistance protein [Myxococcota bacterium]